MHIFSFYVLTSLWSTLPSPAIAPRCTESSLTLPKSTHEFVWSEFVANASAQEVTAFVDVNVVPMDHERVLEHQTVIIKEGRISALGPVNQITIPKGTTRIDGRGKYLIPGLTDMHAHLHLVLGKTDEEAVRHLFRYLAHGVTAVRHLGDGAPYLRFKTGSFFGPRLYLAPSNWELGKMPLDSVAMAIATAKSMGYDFVEIADTYVGVQRKDSFYERGRAFSDSVIAAARRSGLPVASHTNRESYNDMLAFGAHNGSVEHVSYAFGKILGQNDSDVSADEINAIAAATRRAGTWLTVTLDCTEERKQGNITVARRLVKALQDANVGLLLGADADGSHGDSPGVIHEELAEMVRAGLTPYEALLTGTRNVARYFEIQDSVGTVVVGQRADLVLLYGNPLTNIRYTLEPAGVMSNGRWLDRTALDQGLLTSPKSWFKVEILGGILPMISVRGNTFETLIDSLELVKPSDRITYGRLVGKQAKELEAIRAKLTPDQREIFDPAARVWLREQARNGFPVTVRGIMLREQTDSTVSSLLEFPEFLAMSLRDGLDTTVSPCTDFDQFVNGGWRARTALPRGTENLDVFSSTLYQTMHVLRGLIDSVHHVAANTTDADLRVVSTYYESCLQADSLDRAMSVATMYGAVGHDSSRAARCYRLVIKDLQDALGQVFVRAVLPSEAENRARELVRNIQIATDERIKALPWVSAEVKAHTSAALQQMTLKVATPEKAIDHSGLQLSPDDVATNRRKIQAYLWKYNLLGTGGRRPVWNQSQYNPNAFYQSSTNSIEVPTFMFQFPFFTMSGESALGYAGVGVIIGHEIFHGVTRHLDVENNAQFKELAQRLVEHYSTFSVSEGIQINGRKTIDENLADLGGVLTAYNAWQQTDRGAASPDIEGFTPEQRFFLYYARVWRTKTTKEYLNLQSQQDNHAPGRLRINGVLMNVPAFAKAFGCKTGDRMVKTDQIVIW